MRRNERGAMQLVTGVMDGMDDTHPAIDILPYLCLNSNCHRYCHGTILEKLDNCSPEHSCGRAGGGLPSRQWATRSGCSVQNAHDAVASRVRTFAEGAAPQSLNRDELLIPEHGDHVGPGSYSKHNEQVKQWGTPTPLGRNFV
jgi:hypothetical protein